MASLVMVVLGMVVFWLGWQSCRTFDALKRARRRRAHPCYECGQHVVAGGDIDGGEQHGRSGWVHFDCMED